MHARRSERTRSYVLGFHEIDGTQVALVGGKGAALGELSRIEGIHVPAGFCITTEAFRRIVAEAPSIDGLLDRLSNSSDEREAIRTQSAEIRRTIEAIAIPDDLAAAIASQLALLGDNGAYAVRSSATAEDLPTASFAGQQDSYLNVIGLSAILEHVRRCWGSLFTQRAVSYRTQHGFDHRKVSMAVVVQRMVLPEAAGILFTADPVSGNRKVVSIEASFGLGEALVSGLVNPDVYKVRDGEVVTRTVGSKQLAIFTAPGGGTQERTIEPGQQAQPALTDAQAVRLAAIGRQIEAHFGSPQDIEWCLADSDFEIVQSRPITTLFPIPETGDSQNHVYISVGHNQMMTDAMKPLGLSFWQLTTPRPMAESGGRLFVDVTQALASEAGRTGLLTMAGRTDPFLKDALESVLDRGGFIRLVANESAAGSPTVIPAFAPPAGLDADPSIVDELIRHSEVSVDTLKREIETRTGSALLEFILTDLQELRRILFDPRGHQVYMSAMEATWWLNERLGEWLGEKNAADTLAKSVPNNVTSEMGLALTDVADVIRAHPDTVAFLEHVDNDNFLDELPRVAGGSESRDAIRAWLDRYGMRGAGEIDITRTRWSERPTMLLPLILANIRNFEPGTAARRFEEGRQEALAREQELLEKLRALPEGDAKAEVVKRMIDRVRAFMGYREYPKYGKVSRYFLYKQALMKEARRLVDTGVLHEAEDIFYLRFEELQELVRTNRADYGLIDERKVAFASYRALKPPRVLTSEGECISGARRDGDLPEGALVGLPVSAGTIEGRARIILDMAKAEVEPGDILVTVYTDPSWTPLFVSVKGLVTEVGGMMTHGAVIAREYGLPAVVGVEHATRLIRDGQHIRVHGTDGYVELLP